MVQGMQLQGLTPGDRGEAGGRNTGCRGDTFTASGHCNQGGNKCALHVFNLRNRDQEFLLSCASCQSCSSMI